MSSIASFIELGGPIVVILLGISVASLGVILLKAVQFVRLGVGRHLQPRKALALWRAGRPEEASARLSEARSFSGAVLGFAMTELRRAAHGDSISYVSARDRIREDTAAMAADQLARLGSGLRLLDLVAQLAPLLGLLGTVLGMIQAFQSLQEAAENVDPSLLAGGIWVALLTTAAGLVVAIPAMIAAVWFEERIEKERSMLEVLLTGLFASPKRPRDGAAAELEYRSGR